MMTAKLFVCRSFRFVVELLSTHDDVCATTEKYKVLETDFTITL